MIELQEETENRKLFSDLIQPETALALLHTCTSQLQAEATCRELLDYFQARPELPGVIILQADQPIGIVSRNKLFVKLIKPYWRDMYNKRQIAALLEDEDFNAPPLILPQTSNLREMVVAALARPPHAQLDPIVLADGNDYLLVDCQSFFLALSQIIQTINGHLMSQYDENLKLSRELAEQSEQYQALLEQLAATKAESNTRQGILEHQNRELRAQAQTILQQYQELQQLSQQALGEMEQTLKATSGKVFNLNQDLNQVARFSGSLEQELEVMQAAVTEIEHISRQVKHLALQASLMIGKAGGQFNSFSFIASEVNKLGDQCYQANKQVASLAHRLHQRLPEVSQASQTGETTTKELINALKPTEQVLNQLTAAIQQLAQA
jgi:methyl-accepting chemotaxis protein